MNGLSINADQLDMKKGKKKIGTVKGNPVFALVTKGGLNLIVVNSTKGAKLLAAAPHRGLARHMAKQIEPDFVIDELSKSEDDLPVELYKHIMDKWVVATEKINLKLGDLLNG